MGLQKFSKKFSRNDPDCKILRIIGLLTSSIDCMKAHIILLTVQSIMVLSGKMPEAVHRTL